MADSGLVVVVTVITLLLVAVFIPLISVQYEWCQVLFENNTVSEEKFNSSLASKSNKPVLISFTIQPCDDTMIHSFFQENPLCTKNNREDKILLKMETPYSGKSGGRNRFGRKERRLRGGWLVPIYSSYNNFNLILTCYLLCIIVWSIEPG